MSAEIDATLLAAWVGGDQRSGARLYGNHAVSVGRFFRNKVDARDVPDLIQATFLACFEHGDRLHEGASFRAFVFGFARNILFRHYRDKYRRHDKIDFGVSSLVDLGVTPTGIIANEQHQQRLLAALRTLCVEQQILLELYYWEGMRGSELGQLYELPEGTIRTQLRRARQLLAQAFERESSGPAVPVESLEAWARGLREQVGHVDQVEPQLLE
jgi:RNA polymerase sigma factor (sigma-70 family)